MRCSFELSEIMILRKSHLYAQKVCLQARSHTLVEIDHEIISTVILLPSAESFKNVCCQLQAKVCAQSTG